MMHASNDAGHYQRAYRRECESVTTDRLRALAAEAEAMGDYQRAGRYRRAIARRVRTGLIHIDPAFARFDPEAEQQAERERARAQAELHRWDKYGRADGPAATDAGERRAS